MVLPPPTPTHTKYCITAVLVEPNYTEKQVISAQRFSALKASYFLGCIKKSVGSMLRTVILPLCSVLVRTHLEPWVQLLGLKHKKDIDVLE